MGMLVRDRHGRAPELLEAVLAFFGVASVEVWEEGWSAPQFAFRKSLAFDGKVGAMATWLRLGELEAQKVECQPFDKGQLRTAIDEIRTLTVHGPNVFVPQMLAFCAAALPPALSSDDCNWKQSTTTDSSTNSSNRFNGLKQIDAR